MRLRWKAAGALLAISLVAAGCAAEDSPSSTGDAGTDANKPSATGSQGEGTSQQTTPAPSNETIELRVGWWGSQDRHDRTLKAIELFEKKNPNIKILPEFAGNAGYWEKMATQAAANNLPDVFQNSLLYMADYHARGLLLDLEPFLASGAIDLSDVEEAEISSGRLDGKLHALNIGSNTLAEAYDPVMYEKAGVPLPKPGRTWQQFMEEARALKAALGKDVYIRSHLPDFHGFQYFLRGNGTHIYNAGGTALGFEEGLMVEFLTMYDTLLKEGVLAPPAVNADVQGLEDELIVHGLAPNQNIHSNQIVALTKAAGRPLQMTTVPTVEGEGGDRRSAYIRASMFLSGAANTKHPEAVAAFIDFITNDLEANEILAAERGVPISAKVREHLYPSLTPEAQITFEFLETVAPFAGDAVKGAPPGDSEVESAFERCIEKISYGQSTPEQAVKTFFEEANAVLAKNK